MGLQLSLTEAKLNRSELERSKSHQEMKKALMRGVCALNMEAMSVFRAQEPNIASLEKDASTASTTQTRTVPHNLNSNFRSAPDQNTSQPQPVQLVREDPPQFNPYQTAPNPHIQIAYNNLQKSVPDVKQSKDAYQLSSKSSIVVKHRTAAVSAAPVAQFPSSALVTRFSYTVFKD
jgi:cytoskeletal protein RodZ